MPKLSDLLKNQVTLVVPYRGTEITITYKPESVTADRQAELQKRVADGQLERHLTDAAYMVDVLTGWDLNGDDDSPLLISLENCRRLSTSLQMAIVNAIYDDQRNPQPGH
jgi:hypothetical protein